jgi:hypothetical protein
MIAQCQLMTQSGSVRRTEIAENVPRLGADWSHPGVDSRALEEVAPVHAH